MSADCSFCEYDWGTPENVEKHLKRGDCEVNLRLRGQIATGVLLTTFPAITPEEALIIESAGLEVWTHPDDPEIVAAPWWIWSVCQQVTLKAHRVWLLESLARNPSLYLKVTREPASLGKVLLRLMVERR
jgi:hypothetical protein